MITLAALALLASAPAEQVRILYFGATGGVSGHVGRNHSHRRLKGARTVGEGPRAFVHGARAVFAPGGLSIAQFRDFLAAGPLTWEDLGPMPLRVSPAEVLFEWPPAENSAWAASGLAVVEGRRARVKNAAGAMLDAFSAPLEGDGALPVDPAAWELRFIWEGELEGQRLFDLGRPVHDGARRYTALKQLEAEAPERTLILAAGEDVEHFSFVITGAPDLQRPHTWKAFQRLGLDGLVPGHAELAFGQEALEAEATEAAVPLLANRGRLIAVGRAQVLLIGLSPGGEGLTVVEAAKAEAVAKLGRAPDLVVALGHAEGRLPVDLQLTNFGDHGYSPFEVQTTLAPEDEALRRAEGRPIALPSAGGARLGVLDLGFTQSEGGLQLSQVRARALTISTSTPADAALAEAVQRTRQAAYAPAQRPLLPDLQPLLEPGVQLAEAWRQLSANTTREVFDAELALLPRVPFPWGLAGPISRLEGAANLNTPDEVVVLSLRAKQVRALAPLVGELVTSGLDRVGRKVLGRPLDDRQRYRLVTTTSVLADPRFAALLGGARPTDQKLRDAVLDTLEASDAASLPARLSATPPKPDRWLLDAKGLRLEYSQYSVVGDQTPYAEVRETRVTTRENRALRVAGDLIAAREGAALNWVNTAHFEFAEATFDAGTAQETEEELADQARLASELQVLAWPILGGAPYLNLAYATEFTPTESETGTNPRKKRVEGGLGALWKGTYLKSARLGAVLAHDFASEVADPEVGALAALEVRVPVSILVWHLSAEARYYLPDIGEDVDSELGLVLKGRTGLDAPVYGGLTLGVFVDAFGYRGQVEQTQDLGASLISGVALGFDRVFKPGYE